MKLNYLLLDVFTADRFKGNPLAVVLEADDLLDNEMQMVASEFNLSETVFLSKPQSSRNTAAVRIFTPAVELPFAGHPTVGAAVILGQQHKLQIVRIEERVGLITALVENLEKSAGEARFGLPRPPEVAGDPPTAKAVALALSLEESDIGCPPYELSVYSAGNLFYLVPVRNATVLKRISVQRLLWNQTFPLGHHSVYVFTATPDEKANDFAARMFSPGMGLGEDPGTGSAAAALIGLIAKHTAFTDGQEDYVLRQGHEMGRPCRITMQVKKEQGELIHGGIGGQVVIVGEGVLDLGD